MKLKVTVLAQLISTRQFSCHFNVPILDVTSIKYGNLLTNINN